MDNTKPNSTAFRKLKWNKEQILNSTNPSAGSWICTQMGIWPTIKCSIVFFHITSWVNTSKDNIKEKYYIHKYIFKKWRNLVSWKAQFASNLPYAATYIWSVQSSRVADFHRVSKVVCRFPKKTCFHNENTHNRQDKWAI